MRVPNNAPHDSHALIGRRRTGKTAIMVKLFNRLFNEQDRVLPIFISFAEYLKKPEPITLDEFAQDFFAGYLRSYFAFRYRQPQMIQETWNLSELRPFAHQVQDQKILELLEHYDIISDARGRSYRVINMPRSVAYQYEMPSVLLIDEFQVLTNAINPQDGSRWNLTSGFQQAAETHWAPMLVAGSAVTTLVSEALGGALSGRFHYGFIDPLPHEYACDYIFRLAERYGVPVSEELTEAIWQLTEGYPYSIGALLESRSLARDRYPALDALEEVMQYELTDPKGILQQHYAEEFEKYTTLLNGNNLTKKVMFWATKYPGQDIRAERVAEELGANVEDVQAALRKLHQIDVVERVVWDLYQGPREPMLRRYIEYTYRRQVENLSEEEATKDWKGAYRRLLGHQNRFVGKVAEVYIEGVMRRFDGRSLDGPTYFTLPGAYTLPKFSKIERRGGIVKDGSPIELDLRGEWGATEETPPSLWLIQAKYWKTPVGEKEAQDFLQQSESFLTEQRYAHVTRWYFSKSGFTQTALQALEKAGVLVSTLPQFNQLARLFGFIGLPGEK